MTTDFNEIIGFIAALLTTTAFLPQALHSWKTRDLSGISFNMYLTFTLGVTLWLIYGLLIKSMPVIAANVITLPTTLIILSLKIKDMRSNKI